MSFVHRTGLGSRGWRPSTCISLLLLHGLSAFRFLGCPDTTFTQVLRPRIKTCTSWPTGFLRLVTIIRYLFFLSSVPSSPTQENGCLLWHTVDNDNVAATSMRARAVTIQQENERLAELQRRQRRNQISAVKSFFGWKTAVNEGDAEEQLSPASRGLTHMRSTKRPARARTRAASSVTVVSRTQQLQIKPYHQVILPRTIPLSIFLLQHCQSQRI